MGMCEPNSQNNQYNQYNQNMKGMIPQQQTNPNMIQNNNNIQSNIPNNKVVTQNNPAIIPNQVQNTTITEPINYQNLEQYKQLQENEKKLMEQKLQQIQKELEQKYQNQIKLNQNEKNQLISAVNNKDAEINNLKLNLAEKTEPILVGLDNIGATCYMNATLQCLSNIPELTDFFLQKYPSQMTKDKIMTLEYYNLLKELWNRNNKSYAPHSFKNTLSKENELFAGIAANDSKDLINFLLEKFHQELNIPKTNNNINNLISLNAQMNENMMLSIFLNYMKEAYNSPISALFYGVNENITKCLNCQRYKFNFQIFSYLEFPLEQVNKYFIFKGQKSYNGIINPDINLYECFEYYNNNNEKMIGQNQIHCDVCNKLTDAEYGTILYSMPNYLIINLNRGKGAVYKCNVIFPETLNLLNNVKFRDGNTVFQLHSVICHLGPSSMGGHFVAYCKHRLNNKWYKYNDSIVTPCENKNEYLTGLPYILFYKSINIQV